LLIEDRDKNIFSRATRNKNICLVIMNSPSSCVQSDVYPFCTQAFELYSLLSVLIVLLPKHCIVKKHYYR
jgi:hypothetical protein